MVHYKLDNKDSDEVHIRGTIFEMSFDKLESTTCIVGLMTDITMWTYENPVSLEGEEIK